jgi:hypothetical protein
MPLFPDAPVRLRMSGSVRKRPMSGVASVAVDADGVIVTPLDAAMQADAPVRIPFDGVDGVTHAPDGSGTLTIHLRGGEQLAGAGDRRVAQVADAILVRGRTMPELARAIRALGARRGGAAQDAFFQPLLEARRHAVAGGLPAVDAFDAAALRLAFEHRLVSLAAERGAGRPPARRALEARLLDAAESLLAALVPLAGAADRVRNAPPTEALRHWRAWVQALRVVFDRADAAWATLQEVLEHTPQSLPAAAPPATLESMTRRWIR